ncbi:MAG: hypothetical protein A2Y81_03560 [Nitrospirae bacterium RBG_13_43_8]|nr:MAG: hypothetical protein A2Y81_03560 [Nitrospirae bacterium RBG_13_43_8]
MAKKNVSNHSVTGILCNYPFPPFSLIKRGFIPPLKKREARRGYDMPCSTEGLQCRGISLKFKA